MLGTIVNTCAIIVGSLVGAFLKKGVAPKYQDALFNALGLCSLALGCNAFCQAMPKSSYPVLFIVALSVGALSGYALDLDGHVKRLIDRKRESADGQPCLSEGLTTGILLYCIGTFSIVGPVLSALYGDNTFLYTNSTLDLISSMVLATTFGIGMIWAAPVLFLWQGMFYAIAKLNSAVITDDIKTELCIVGGVLIIGAGLNLLKIKDCRVINLLPAFLVIILFFALKSLF